MSKSLWKQMVFKGFQRFICWRRHETRRWKRCGKRFCVQGLFLSVLGHENGGFGEVFTMVFRVQSRVRESGGVFGLRERALFGKDLWKVPTPDLVFCTFWGKPKRISHRAYLDFDHHSYAKRTFGHGTWVEHWTHLRVDISEGPLFASQNLEERRKQRPDALHPLKARWRINGMFRACVMYVLCPSAHII